LGVVVLIRVIQARGGSASCGPLSFAHAPARNTCTWQHAPLPPNTHKRAQLRLNALAAVYAITCRAAPDITSDAEWLELTRTSNNPAATATAAAVAASTGAAALPLDRAAREAAILRLEAAVRQLVLLPLERLHAGAYTLREPFVQHLEREAAGGGSAGDAQTQHTQRAGNARAGGAIAGPSGGAGGGGGGGSQVVFAATAGQRQQTNSIIPTVLARMYALQLQSGRASWREVEGQVLAPYPNLNVFWVHCGSVLHRRMVVYLAARLVQDTPSIVAANQWAREGETEAATAGNAGPRRAAVAAAASAAGGPPEPAVWLLKMWLRAVVDSTRGCSLSHLSWVLAQLPQTRSLFGRLGWLSVANEAERLEGFNADWGGRAAAARLMLAGGSFRSGAAAAAESARFGGKVGGLRGTMVDAVLRAMGEEAPWAGRLLEVRAGCPLLCVGASLWCVDSSASLAARENKLCCLAAAQ